MEIFLSKYNGTGSMASIENFDHSSIEICGDEGTDPAEACRAASQLLRDAAARFDMLASEANPYAEATHRRINNMKVFHEQN